MSEKSYIRDFEAICDGCTSRQLSDLGEFNFVQMHVRDRDYFTEKGARKAFEEYYIPNREELPQGILSSDASFEEKGIAALIYITGMSSSDAWAWREPDWELYFRAPFVSAKEEKSEEEESEEMMGL